MLASGSTGDEYKKSKDDYKMMSFALLSQTRNAPIKL